jgi:hypothetical protein
VNYTFRTAKKKGSFSPGPAIPYPAGVAIPTSRAGIGCGLSQKKPPGVLTRQTALAYTPEAQNIFHYFSIHRPGTA